MDYENYVYAEKGRFDFQGDQGLTGTSPEPQRSKSRAFMLVSTLLGTNISPSKALLELIFLFQKWDMI